MTPLVLIPGMMCDARLFGPQIAEFSGQRSLHLAAIDAHDTVAALARQILEQAPPRFALAGLSMGGIVAMQIIAEAPGRVERLALLDTNPLAETEAVKARRSPQIERAQSGQLARVMRDEMKPNYLTNGPDRAAILVLCMQMALGLGPEVFARQSRALMSRPDQSAALSGISVPTLVLCGAEDTLCPVSRHQMMHRLIPDATLEVIENAGHMPTLEQPERTNEALMRWLEE